LIPSSDDSEQAINATNEKMIEKELALLIIMLIQAPFQNFAQHINYSGYLVYSTDHKM